jgi:hypothetical protein
MCRQFSPGRSTPCDDHRTYRRAAVGGDLDHRTVVDDIDRGVIDELDCGR